MRWPHVHRRLLDGSEASACLLLALRVDTVMWVRIGCAGTSDCAIFVCVRVLLKPAFNWVLDGMAPADADASIVVLALDRRKKRILCQLLIWRRSHLLFSWNDRTHIRFLHQGKVTIYSVVVRPVISNLLVLSLCHSADKRFDWWLHLIFTPEFQDSLIALFLGVISHAQSRFVRVVRVKRVPQEIQPFHHHELHRFVELCGICATLASLHALTGSLCSRY